MIETKETLIFLFLVIIKTNIFHDLIAPVAVGQRPDFGRDKGQFLSLRY